MGNISAQVHSALPAIDASAPAERNHVAHKLKKVQREEERVCRIESDNVRLLQRMAAIMRTSRLDNRWITEPPGRKFKSFLIISFLGRIGIYAPPTSSTTSRRESVVSEPQVTSGVGRKASCSACALKRLQQEQLDVPIKSAQPTDVEKLPKVKPADCVKPKKKKARSLRLSAPSSEAWTPPEWAASSRVVLTRGQLQVSVAYPAHTAVQVERAGCTPLVLETEFCSCAAKLPPSAAC
ncbi:hypothetical protein B566_EDAN003051 [Ephemera danica]|nr:hypothetical protein B566_EDAN003051 [Ephemera danica]